MEKIDIEFVNKYIENLAASLVQEQREKLVLKTNLDIALKKIEKLENDLMINTKEKQTDNQE